MSTIVVGVDGSDASLDALRWALQEARLRASRVVAVYVWLFPSLGLRPAGARPPGYDELRRSAGGLLDEAVDAVVGAVGGGVEIERAVVEGTPSEVLTAAARHAEMLVLGSRGLGGFAGLLLGSVSQQCAHHAPCPVVIVRHGAGGGSTSGSDGGDA